MRGCSPDRFNFFFPECGNDFDDLVLLIYSQEHKFFVRGSWFTERFPHTSKGLGTLKPTD